ncbi:MAG TPA: polyphosphate kinase 1 [Planctomycetota bacterium]|nr:polyphosphate kinase 1 [Planctomycetota bacterium]
MPDVLEQAAPPEPLFFNRELSWIEFNSRVLDEALDQRNPLLERIRFLAIWASNLDEFFMIRVGAVKEQIAGRVQRSSADGLTPNEQLAAVRKALQPLRESEFKLLLEDLIPKLREQGIYLLDSAQLGPNQKAFLAEYFDRQVFPVLTPLVFDPSHPFPHISNLSLNLAVVIQDPEAGELFARVKVPEVLPRFVPLPAEAPEGPAPAATGGGEVPPERRHYFAWLEQVIAAHLATLFPGVTVAGAHSFRVARNADLEIVEDEAGDLLRTIEEGVRQRRFGEAVRLAVAEGMPEGIRNLLMTNLDLEPGDVDVVRRAQGLSDLMALTKLDRPDLKWPPIYPSVPAALRGPLDIFSAIRQQDVLLHHPYDSFAPVVDFIQAAAADPDVLAIKQTLYRVGSDSPIVRALMNARERGKQVSVLVELKARFDEENNITWARALERAGVHVVYGVLGLKTHAKIALVVRKEPDGIRRYVHLGTGNYNAATARAYTDFGLLTARPDIGADASELFNFLTGHSRQDSYRKLLVAPITLRRRILELIDREIASHRESGGGHTILKVNSLVDAEVIQALYRASEAGVQVDLIVRGMCCLRPGLPGLSESIRVRSIVGPYLEHSRAFYFRNGGNEEVYFGSADLMERNLNRRVEVVFPIEDSQLIRHVRGVILESFLRDNCRARLLKRDGTYERIVPGPDEPIVDSQAVKKA